MSADRLAASNGGPGVSHTRRPEAGQQTPTPVAFPACVSTGAVCHGARDLPAVSRAHSLAALTDCPTASDRGGW